MTDSPATPSEVLFATADALEEAHEMLDSSPMNDATEDLQETAARIDTSLVELKKTTRALAVNAEVREDASDD